MSARAAAVAAMVTLASGAAFATKEVPRLRPWTRGETPALAGTDLAGRPLSLAALRGRAVLVAFWASWCEPCATELPALAALRERLAGRPFEVLTVNLGENPARVEQFVRQHRITVPVLLDRDREAGESWGVGGLPMAFLVGADGRVRSWIFGESDWREPALAATLEALVRDAERSAAPSGAATRR